MLWPHSYAPGEFIFYEDELIENIYFIKGGSANYVLPQFFNQPYINLEESSYFGLIDIVAANTIYQNRKGGRAISLLTAQTDKDNLGKFY